MQGRRIAALYLKSFGSAFVIYAAAGFTHGRLMNRFVRKAVA